jgi:RES domain-containing protein
VPCGGPNEGGRLLAPAVVYTSESISLTLLEQLVHVEDPAALDAFVVVSATLDESTVETLAVASLPDDWRAYPEKTNHKADHRKVLAAVEKRGDDVHDRNVDLDKLVAYALECLQRTHAGIRSNA